MDVKDGGGGIATTYQQISTQSSTLQDFEIMKKLGQGSYGIVFKVRRKKDQNIYVLKQISTAGMKNQQRRECINEAILLNKLNSPYIVRYYDSFLENNLLNIVMEYCEQGDLENFIKNQMGRPLIEKRIWKIFFQIAEGLFELHSQNILHRDIKCLNIFITGNEQIRIGDLGVAKQLSESKTHAHNQVGTPFFMSPEIMLDIPYNEKSDVWSLGCVLYQLITFKRPFEANNATSLMMKIQKAQYTPISSNYSPQLHKLIELCLTKDHLKRPSIIQLLCDADIQLKAKQVGYTLTIRDIIRSKEKGGGGGGEEEGEVKMLQGLGPKIVIQSKDIALFTNFERLKQQNLGNAVRERTSVSAKKGDHLLVQYLDHSKINHQVREPSNKESNPFIINQNNKIFDKKKSIPHQNFSPSHQRPLSHLISSDRSQHVRISSSIESALSKNKDDTDKISPKSPFRASDRKAVLLNLPAVYQGSSYYHKFEPKVHGDLIRIIPQKNHMKSTKSQINYGHLSKNGIGVVNTSIMNPNIKKEAITNVLKPNDYHKIFLSEPSSQQEMQAHISNPIQSKIRIIASESQFETAKNEKISVSSSQQIPLSVEKMKRYVSAEPTIIKSQIKENSQHPTIGLSQISATPSIIKPRKKVFLSNASNQLILHSALDIAAGSQPADSIAKKGISKTCTIINSPEVPFNCLTDVIEIPKKTENPLLHRLFKQRFDLQIQAQQISKACVANLGINLYKEVLRIFKQHINCDQELTNQDHDKINIMIDEKLKNKKECVNKFYKLISLENQLNDIQSQIKSIELNNKLSK